MSELIQPLVLNLDALNAKNDSDDNIGAPLVGGKGASLFQLVKDGMPVPEFCCLTSHAFVETLKANRHESLVSWLNKPSNTLPIDRSTIEKKIRDCVLPEQIIKQVTLFLEKYPNDTFAVRSSGTVEDGADASFAGLFETVLNVSAPEDIYSAIKDCWASLFNERVQVYLDRNPSSAPLGIAVVLQRLVCSEKSGVLFSVDPVKGHDTNMLIEACFGLGEALVSGQVTPDQYRYDWYNESETERTIAEKEVICKRYNEAPFVRVEALENELASQPVLSLDEIRELVALSLRIQVATKFPVDIEWGKVGDKFYILQSRPITQFGYADIKGEWTTADFRDGGVSSSVCTPYMASLYKSIIDVSMGGYLQTLKLKKYNEGEWQRSFFGRPYWNLGEAKKNLAKIPGFNERAFDEGLGIAPSYEGDGVVAKTTPSTLYTGLRALLIIQSNCRKQLRDAPQFADEQKNRLSELSSVSLSALNTESLFNLYQQLMKVDYPRSESTYFNFIYDNSNLNALFKEDVEKTSFDMNLYPSLLSGLSSVSHMAPVEDMWGLRETIAKSEVDLSYWTKTDASLIVGDIQSKSDKYQLDKVRSYLAKFGHHSKQELDLMVPRYWEDIEYVVNQLKQTINQPIANDPRPRNSEQSAKAKDACEALLNSVSFIKRKSIAKRLKQVREFLWWREELRDLSTKFYMYVRKISLELEARLLDQGYLKSKNDIFFLSMNDVLSITAGDVDTGVIHKTIAKNKAYYQSFADFEIPDEIGERYGAFGNLSAEMSTVPAESGFAGVAGSPGVVTGVARVIANIHDADRLQPGDILVTRCTDPGWTPKFAMLSGVVTETGGILSHAAVICREYGMPAVLAVKGATKNIKDGDVITVNGSAGVVSFSDVESESSDVNDKNNLLDVA